jgi:hypothetical protein
VEDVGCLILAEYAEVDDLEQLQLRPRVEHGINAPVDLLARIKVIHAGWLAGTKQDRTGLV